MKKSIRTLLCVLALATLFLTACSGATTSAPPSNLNANANDSNTSEENGNDPDVGSNEVEVIGVVEAMTADTLTISGVMYTITDFTEFMNVIRVGDQVNIHTITNTDGTFTISEIEISDGMGNDSGDQDGDDNGENEKG